MQTFAESFGASHDGLDLLINNAGVMAPPRRQTDDGFELQLGTNLLGHFALTGRLIAVMEGRAQARVVTLSSNAHKMGRINFDDLQSERHYRRWNAYGQSKLADLMFSLELDRRLRAASSTVTSVAAHPGYAATNLQTAAPPLADRLFMTFTNLIMAQSAEMGALPTLYAATYPDLAGGSYVGPDGIGEFRGHPHLVSRTAARATSRWPRGCGASPKSSRAWALRWVRAPPPERYLRLAWCSITLPNASSSCARHPQLEQREQRLRGQRAAERRRPRSTRPSA